MYTLDLTHCFNTEPVLRLTLWTCAGIQPLASILSHPTRPGPLPLVLILYLSLKLLPSLFIYSCSSGRPSPSQVFSSLHPHFECRDELDPDRRPHVVPVDPRDPDDALGGSAKVWQIWMIQRRYFSPCNPIDFSTLPLHYICSCYRRPSTSLSFSQPNTMYHNNSIRILTGEPPLAPETYLSP